MLELHPLCTLFPRLSGAEFDALCADIKENGLRQPIVTHGGMILDGGNRYRACIEIGVEPLLTEFVGGNIVSFVLSANLHRRHLSRGQHAAIVSSAQDWAKAQAAHRPEKAAHGEQVTDTTQSRAVMSGASISTQRRADAVAKADPELAKQVAHGEVTLSQAVTQAAPQLAPRKAGNDGDDHGVPAERPKKPSSPSPEKPIDSALIEELREVISNLEDANHALTELNKDIEQENRALLVAVDPEVHALVKKTQVYAKQLEERRDGLMASEAKLMSELKKAERMIDRLKKDLAAAKQGGGNG